MHINVVDIPFTYIYHFQYDLSTNQPVFLNILYFFVHNIQLNTVPGFISSGTKRHKNTDGKSDYGSAVRSLLI